MLDLKILSESHPWSWMPPAWQQAVEQSWEDETCNPPDLAVWEELNLREAPLFELSLLRNFPGLRSLDLSDVPAENFGPVSGLELLTSFEALGCRPGNLGFLANLTNLRMLDISYPLENPTHWDSLASLLELEEVYVNHCGLKSLAPFDHLPNLQVLCVYFNQIPREEMQRFTNEHPQCRLMA